MRRAGGRPVRRRQDEGAASLEVLAMLPVLFGVALMALQAGVVGLAASSTQEAARTAARASSLGRDPEAAARASLPGALRLTSVQIFGPGHGVRLRVEVPRVSPLPTFTIEREAVLP